MKNTIAIVMTIRENYSLTLQTIDSLIKHTTLPYKFILIDYKVPDFIMSEIYKYNISEMEIVKSDSSYPSQSMSNIIPNITTDYTVFLDNNLLFSKFWLENLVQCMEKTNSGIVGPVYLWNTDKIHMFGGDININNGNFTEHHALINYDKNIIRRLRPRKCAYVEYHCLMIKTTLLRQGVLDPSLLTVHQHIDLSLAARKLGYDTNVTPYSVVTYVNNVVLQDYELDFFKTRWDIDLVEKDIEYFCKKWGFTNNHNFDNVRNFVINHNKKYLNIP